MLRRRGRTAFGCRGLVEGVAQLVLHPSFEIRLNAKYGATTMKSSFQLAFIITLGALVVACSGTATSEMGGEADLTSAPAKITVTSRWTCTTTWGTEKGSTIQLSIDPVRGVTATDHDSQGGGGTESWRPNISHLITRGNYAGLNYYSFSNGQSTTSISPLYVPNEMLQGQAPGARKGPDGKPLALVVAHASYYDACVRN
jgi:hypothetical protein